MAKTEKRRTFPNVEGTGVGLARGTADPKFQAAVKKQRRGQPLDDDELDLVVTDEVDVVEIDTVSGPRKVRADRADRYREVAEFAKVEAEEADGS